MDAYLHCPRERCALRVRFKNDEAYELTMALLIAVTFAEKLRSSAPDAHARILNQFVAQVSSLRSLEARLCAAVMITTRHVSALSCKWVGSMFMAHAKRAESMVQELHRRRV